MTSISSVSYGKVGQPKVVNFVQMTKALPFALSIGCVYAV